MENQTAEERRVLSVADVARALGVSHPTAWRAVKAGQLPAVRIGRRLFVPKAAFERFLETAGREGL